MIASGTSYRPASSSARNNILSWRPQASQVRIGSFARSIPFVFHRSLYSSLVCPTANNSVRIIVRQTWQLLPREGGEEAHCAEKIKRQFRGSSPQNACARSFNKREIYLRSDGPYPWIPWTGSLFQRRCCWLYCRHLGQRRSRHCSELGRMNVLVSVNAPSATFRESTSPFSFEIFLLTTIPSYFWPRHCLRAAPLVFLPSSVEEKRNRSNTNRERHSALVSMNYHLAWSIVTPNGLYYFDLLGLLNRRFRVGRYLLWVFAIFFFVDNSDLLSLLLLALSDSFSLPFMLDK